MSLRCERCLAYFFFLAGIGLLGWAAFMYLAPPPGPALEADETTIEVADVIPGRVREVALRLRNSSGQPVRIVGLALC
jgi:hypothetical protein